MEIAAMRRPPPPCTVHVPPHSPPLTIPLPEHLVEHGAPLDVRAAGLAEQEAVVLRFMGGDGKPYNTFFNLAPLDLSTVHDKRSPDADCITACYATSLEQLQLEAHAGRGPIRYTVTPCLGALV